VVIVVGWTVLPAAPAVVFALTHEARRHIHDTRHMHDTRQMTPREGRTDTTRQKTKKTKKPKKVIT
jgi:hypothetical protein